MSSEAFRSTAAPGVLEQAHSAQRRVAPFMIVAVISLLLGLWAGLARIGWDMPAADGSLMLRHGGLMVSGFIVTVIAVERAVALRSAPAFAAPALSAASGIALIAGADDAAPVLATAAAAVYAANVALLLQRHRMPTFIIALAGGVCLVAAGVLWWRGEGFSRVVPWWIAFLVLTIAAERLEILRFRRFGSIAVAGGAASLAMVLLGPLLTLEDRDGGTRLLGAGLALGAAWLLSQDIALRTVRTDGIARFAAAGVLSAYGWLALAGVLLLAWGLGGGGLQYDAVVHAFFIGFVFSAIMAHEPIIAPAVTGLRFSYTPLLYLPLAVLDSGLLLRIVADIAEDSGGRRWAGMAQAIAILVFLAVSIVTLFLSRLPDRRAM